jgi:hypothetical protein
MSAKIRLIALLLIGIILAGCGGGLPPDIASALTATAEASMYSGVTPAGEFGASPNPVYYGSGCGSGESTQLITYLSTTGAWTKELRIPEGSKVMNLEIGLYYEFLDVPVTFGYPGKVIPIFSTEEKIPGYFTAVADLSTETFNGKPGKLVLFYYVSATLLDISSPFTFSTDTKTVYTSGMISIPALPCGKPTPTPEWVNYRGFLTFSPETIYKGDCTGGEPQEFTVSAKPGVTITDPAIELWAVLQYWPITGSAFGEMSYQLFKVGDTWQATIKSSDWSAITKDGYIAIKVRVQKGDPTAPTVLQEWGNLEAGIVPGGVNLRMCKPTVPALAITCPPDTKYTASSASGFATTYGFPTTTGGCSGDWYFTCTPPSGSTFPVGITAVTCTAIDSCGNTASCKFNVTINYFAPVPTDTPVPQVFPTDTPVPPFNCSTLQDEQSCISNQACQWTPPNPNMGLPGACTNKP